MARWRGAAAVVVSLAGLVGCNTGDSTTPGGPSAAVPIAGPTWRLTSIAGRPVLPGTALTALFSTENRVSGTAGCNNYFGSAKAESGRLAVGPLASTLMACGTDGVMEQEARYLAALQAATRYEIRGDELRLGSSAAETTLVFTAR
jgi:heat shock protein HslJ